MAIPVDGTAGMNTLPSSGSAFSGLGTRLDNELQRTTDDAARTDPPSAQMAIGPSRIGSWADGLVSRVELVRCELPLQLLRRGFEAARLALVQIPPQKRRLKPVIGVVHGA